MAKLGTDSITRLLPTNALNCLILLVTRLAKIANSSPTQLWVIPSLISIQQSAKTLVPLFILSFLLYFFSLVLLWIITRRRIHQAVCLFQDLVAAIYRIIRTTSRIGLPRLSQQQPVVRNLMFSFLLIVLYPVCVIAVHFFIISISLGHYRYYLLCFVLTLFSIFFSFFFPSFLYFVSFFLDLFSSPLFSLYSSSWWGPFT